MAKAPPPFMPSPCLPQAPDGLIFPDRATLYVTAIEDRQYKDYKIHCELGPGSTGAGRGGLDLAWVPLASSPPLPTARRVGERVWL